MNSSDEMEKPAKKWEVARLSDKMENQESLIKGLGDKMDKMDAKQITKSDLDEKLADFTMLLNNEVDKIHLKYGPLAKHATKLVWALVTAGIGLVIQIGIIAVQIAITKG